MSENKENIHKGHRQKLKNQFYEAGLDHMPDHVVLEMLLFFGIPYKDTNPIAHELINSFGSFAGVLRADLDDLKNIKGMTENAACLIKMMLPVFNRYSESLASKTPKLQSPKEIVDYIRQKFNGTYNEIVYALCFDSEHDLISVREIGSGDVSQAFISFRRIAQVALETKTRDIVLVHNHPYSIALPSAEDVETTKRVHDFLLQLKVKLSDHIIIAEQGFCSMASIAKYKYIFSPEKNASENSEDI